jgi:hypothetical protein
MPIDIDEELLNRSANLGALQAQLREWEKGLGRQILNLGVFQSNETDGENFARFAWYADVDKFPDLTVQTVDSAVASDPKKFFDFYTKLAENNYLFDYAYVLINQQDTLVILMRPGVLPTAKEFPNSPRLPAPQPPTGNGRKVKASSFADPKDIAGFRSCKAAGGSDQECFKKGDNGIGFCGADCTGPTPMCALPPDDWMPKWGGKQAANLKPVNVTINGKTVKCLMGDTMPHRENITNGAGIDLSPAAVAAFGLKPPIMVDAEWSWA